MNNTLRTTFLLITTLTVIPLAGCNSSDSQTTPTYPPMVTVPDDTIDHQGEMKILQAAITGDSHFQVQSSGTISVILPDDNQGSHHQKFILALPSGHTVLVAHNIDIAPRIPDVIEGMNVQFYGEYVWNNKGGIIHWTHRDPKNKHIHGWLKAEGKTYQ